MGPAEQKLAATEGAWAYHTVNHNHSFRSTDCTSKLVQKCFEAKYGCARTKTEAIVSNVLAPFAAEELENDLQSVNYVTLFTDSSNHKSTKVFPILVRYFKPDAGVYVKILELTNLNGETAEIVSNYLTETITKHKLDTKVVGLCADNTNSNFGGAARLGKKQRVSSPGENTEAIADWRRLCGSHSEQCRTVCHRLSTHRCTEHCCQNLFLLSHLHCQS
jgi:hypothetical protein